ncbi:hypothetical protein U2F26_25540 [Micromonospora sp. 4G57]|uniref:WGR domain-containing protein n=1 Tax=Micromonospora sicca TaxID=2202420 RepID=A0ABU5JJQ3_9ACTN|nr:MULTISPECIES: hypothetical protein [unclassified Micromonospora]MDZ5446056.1 hypothetical protein [Micromonospora sp. 4G57]MDZ5492811.1 hypothetical protein [Micromonospora sp. 4G53]
MEVRGRYWNGAWGRMARRDIWLVSDGQLWRVRGRLGGDGGQEVSYGFRDEASARSMADRMVKTSAGTWRDLTEAVRQEANRPQTH